MLWMSQQLNIYIYKYIYNEPNSEKVPNLTTSDCINIFYISIIMYMPGTVVRFN